MPAMEERWSNRKDKISMIPVDRGMNGVIELTKIILTIRFECLNLSMF